MGPRYDVAEYSEMHVVCGAFKEGEVVASISFVPWSMGEGDPAFSCVAAARFPERFDPGGAAHHRVARCLRGRCAATVWRPLAAYLIGHPLHGYQLSHMAACMSSGGGSAGHDATTTYNNNILLGVFGGSYLPSWEFFSPAR